MILNNFKLLDDACTNTTYRNCIWTFDVVTDIDMSEQVLTADYQPLDSLLPVDGRKNYIKKSSNILDTAIDTLNNLIFKKTQELVFAEEIKKTFSEINRIIRKDGIIYLEIQTGRTMDSLKKMRQWDPSHKIIKTAFWWEKTINKYFTRSNNVIVNFKYLF